eukprot:5568401-Alexandrium_andersonii.AAC.1
MRLGPDQVRSCHATAAGLRARATYGCAGLRPCGPDRRPTPHGGLALFAWNGWIPRQLATYNADGGQAMRCTLTRKGTV